MRPIALIGDLFQDHAILADARAVFDGAIDVLLGHILGLGFVDDQPQAEVEVGIAALARRQLELTRQLGEHLAALRIGRALLALDRSPF